MAEVFVSYASPDRELAFKVAAYLEGEGIACWIAPRDVPPGKEYGAAIIAAIEGCRALVLILSEHSNDSQFVHKEVERAVSKTKPVLPVRVREVAPSGALEFFISSAQWVDAWRPPMEEHLARLAATLRAMAGAPPAPARTAPPRRRRLPLVAAALGGVLVLAGAGLYLWSPWLPAWQRAGKQFLVGSWCQPMSGDTFARSDFSAGAGDLLYGETHFSHSSDVARYRVHVAADAGGFTLTAEPASDDGPARYRVLDNDHMALVFAAGKAQDLPPMKRCAPASGD